MPGEYQSVAKISAFRGMQGNTDAADVQTGYSEFQVNCCSHTIGELTERPGLAPIDFDGTAVAANRAPVLAAISDQSIANGNLLTFTASATDPEATAVRYFIGRAPAGADMAISTGVFRWTPTASQIGVWPLDVIACDSADPCNSATLTINITVT